MNAKTSILIVDDLPANLALLANLLSRQGYDIRPARDGAFALASAAAQPPDLILLDVMMPGLTGYDVCEQLKADPLTRDIPVIFISALGETLDKVKALSLGAVDYVTKPFEAEEVLARVRTHLTLRRMQQQLERQNQELREQIAARERAESELRERNEELEERNRELDAFAHTVAHDLRTPVAHALGYAELLALDGELLSDEEHAKALEVIARSGRRMTRIIDNLLILSELRHAEVPLHSVRLDEVVSDVLERLSPLIDPADAIVVQPQRWPGVRGYTAWIEEVLANYISNAVKYGGKPPQIELGYTRLPDDRVRIWVRDNGAGLAREEQAQLFVPFTRLNQAQIKGHGLGLSIVRRIMERIGGGFGVESTKGAGSTFYITLAEIDRSSPAAAPPHARQEPEQAPPSCVDASG